MTDNILEFKPPKKINIFLNEPDTLLELPTRMILHGDKNYPECKGVEIDYLNNIVKYEEITFSSKEEVLNFYDSLIRFF